MQQQNIFLLSQGKRPNLLWGLPVNGHRSRRGVRLATYLHLVPRITMNGAMLPPPIYPHGVQRDNIISTFTFYPKKFEPNIAQIWSAKQRIHIYGQ